MPIEEHKELRELVTQTLQAKGVLEKVQAEIRASVFLALEEQHVFKDKSPFINQPLQEFVATNDGLLAISLIREFLEFFNLEFTAMVFDPETHAGINYSYDGRDKLAKDLMIDMSDNKLPLLALVLKLLKTTSKNLLDASLPKLTSLNMDDREDRPSLPNGLNGNSEGGFDSFNMIDLNKTDEGIRPESLPVLQLNSNSLASLSNLPSLARTSVVSSTNVKNEDIKMVSKDIRSTIDIDTASEDELVSSYISDKLKKDKIETGSEASEVEEEISDNLSETVDDTTIDSAISKVSDKGDYMEDL